MLKIGGVYRYRVGSYINPTEFEIIAQEDDYFIGRSRDSFEVKWFFNDEGRQIGTQYSGLHNSPIDVWLVHDEVSSRVSAGVLDNGSAKACHG